MVYLVGILYDDFSEGGFATVFITTDKSKAILKAIELYKPSREFFGATHYGVYEMKLESDLEYDYNDLIYTTKIKIGDLYVR